MQISSFPDRALLEGLVEKLTLRLVLALRKVDGIFPCKKEVFKYSKIYQLSGLSLNKFLNFLKKWYILIDCDARTRHNHGTKFRFRKNQLPALYEDVKEIDYLRITFDTVSFWDYRIFQIISIAIIKISTTKESVPKQWKAIQLQ